MADHRYKQLKVLGQGAFGQVLKVADIKRCPTYALKIFTGGERSKRDFEREVSAFLVISAKPNCDKFVVCLQDYGQLDASTYYVVTELMNGDLDDFSNVTDAKYRIRDPAAMLLFMLQCLLGLKSIAEAGMAHSDLKPANILYKVYGGKPVTDATFNDPSMIKQHVKFKIGDLGLSCTTATVAARGSELLKNASICAPAGTPMYMAPEMYRAFNDRTHSGTLWKYQKNDIWGMGQIFIAMMFGSNHIVDPRNILSQFNIRYPVFDSGSADYDAIINDTLHGMLLYKNSDRKSAAELAKTISDFLSSRVSIF